MKNKVNIAVAVLLIVALLTPMGVAAASTSAATFPVICYFLPWLPFCPGNGGGPDPTPTPETPTATEETPTATEETVTPTEETPIVTETPEPTVTTQTPAPTTETPETATSAPTTAPAVVTTPPPPVFATVYACNVAFADGYYFTIGNETVNVNDAAAVSYAEHRCNDDGVCFWRVGLTLNTADYDLNAIADDLAVYDLAGTELVPVDGFTVDCD